MTTCKRRNRLPPREKAASRRRVSPPDAGVGRRFAQLRGGYVTRAASGQYAGQYVGQYAGQYDTEGGEPAQLHRCVREHRSRPGSGVIHSGAVNVSTSR